jgi:RHS repeat-associated protein
MERLFLIISISAVFQLRGNEQLTVSWSANAEPVDGYKVYWGTESRNYTYSVDVGKMTSYMITGLTNGVSYYIAVKAYVDLRETYYYHTDHLGTPIMMTDKNQNVVWNGEFLPFGEVYSITGTITNNLRFPGQYYDEETGLHYNWHRDYKTEIGRYIEVDPIGFEGGDVNFYVFVNNSPVNFKDPKGLFLGKCLECDEKKLEQCLKPFLESDACQKCMKPGDPRDYDCMRCEGENWSILTCYLLHCSIVDCKKKCEDKDQKQKKK